MNGDKKFYIAWRPGLDFPHLYKDIKIDGYLVSISYLEKEKPQDLHEYFNFKGNIIIDSGAYTYGKRKKFPEEDYIASLQASWGADYVMPLDRPLLFAKTEKEKIKFENKTIKNNYLWQKFDDKYNFKSYWVIQSRENSFKEIIRSINSDLIAIGGKAIQAMNGKIYPRKKYVEQLKFLRSKIGIKKKIHLLGYSGVSSFKDFSPYINSWDSLAPQLFAAYRTILVDKPSFKKPKWLKNQSQAQVDVDNCRCQVCKENNCKVLEHSSEGERLRFLHNSWWLSNYYRSIDPKSKSILGFVE